MNFSRRVIAVFLGILGLAVQLSAQGSAQVSTRRDGPRITNPAEPIPVGPMLFSPSLQLTWQHRDNIFFTPIDPVADEVYVARAAFVLELPIHESIIKLAYRPLYRDYKDYEVKQNWSHFLDLIGAFEFSNGLIVNATYQYVDASQETREVDPGGELAFGDNPFKRNFFGLGLDYWFTARDGVRVEANHTAVAYDDPLTGPSPDPEETQFYDYSRTHYRAGWLHQLNAVLVMDVLYGRSQFDPVDTFAWRTSTSDQVTVGLKGQLSGVFSTEIRVGWRQTEYGTFAGEQVIEDFSSWIVQGFVNWDLGHGSSVRLRLRRSDFPSAYGVNPYFTATGADLRYLFDRGKFFFETGGRFQSNDYPLPDLDSGVKRGDELQIVGAMVGYRFTSVLSLYGSYLWENRDSNVERFGYTSNIYSLGVAIGIGP